MNATKLKALASYVFDFDSVHLPAVSKVVLVAAGIRLALCIFRWPLISILTVFLEPVLEIAASIFFAVALIWAIIHASRKSPQPVTNRYSPALLALAALLVYLFIPFDTLYLKANFLFFLNRRTAAAEQIVRSRPPESSMLMGRGDRVDLPGMSDEDNGIYWHNAGKRMVLFFTFRGILDHFSGFVYSANDAAPQNEDFGGKFVEVEHLRKNWYWVASI